jgi:transcriptional antiterminator NusG
MIAELNLNVEQSLHVAPVPIAAASEKGGTVARKWYAVSVFPRHEKHVARFLEVGGMTYLLPLYSSLRRWKDRQKRVDMVLFPGYVFVNIKLGDRASVLKLPGVSRFIMFQGQPAVVSDSEIEGIGISTKSGLAVEPHPYLKKGRRVRIRSGPMAGVEGILVRRKGTCRLVLSIESIMRSVATEVDEADVEPLI